jgi:two-component system response regulator NreC
VRHGPAPARIRQPARRGAAALISIVLAEDHQIVREGIRALLKSEPGFSVTGEAESGLGVVDLVTRLKPTVLIVDLSMPGLGGLEITRQVRQRCPSTRVIVLSMHASEPFVLEALRVGAAGYVLKSAGVTDLVKAVHEVVAGRRFLSPPLSDLAIESYVQRATATGPVDPYDALTTREREIFHLAAEGHGNTAIATRLSISPRTAESHRANLMRKLGLKSQTELIRFAIRHGIIPADQ